MPVALDEESEPDVAVVPGDPRDYRDAHPARPVSRLTAANYASTARRWPTGVSCATS